VALIRVAYSLIFASSGLIKFSAEGRDLRGGRPAPTPIAGSATDHNPHKLYQNPHNLYTVVMLLPLGFVRFERIF